MAEAAETIPDPHVMSDTLPSSEHGGGTQTDAKAGVQSAIPPTVASGAVATTICSQDCNPVNIRSDQRQFLQLTRTSG